MSRFVTTFGQRGMCVLKHLNGFPLRCSYIEVQKTQMVSNPISRHADMRPVNCYKGLLKGIYRDVQSDDVQILTNLSAKLEKMQVVPIQRYVMPFMINDQSYQKY